MAEILQGLIIFLKIAVPAAMLKFPFFGLWGNYFLDVVDGDILLSLGMNENTYQLLDKSTDFISYFFMLALGLRWKIRKVILTLFVYRMVGQILFFITGNELVFFYFQNFLEPLMMVYALIILKQKSEEKAYATYKKHIVRVWLVVIAYKVWNEWYLHFANIDLSQLFFGFTGGD